MTGSKKVRYLKPEEWPEPDRKAWLDACKPHQRLQRGGRAAHMKPVSQHDLAQRYGCFVGFLERIGQLKRTETALAQVTPEMIERYVADLSRRVSSVTVHGSISKLRRVIEIIDPAFDVQWLKERGLELQENMQPKSRANQIVSSKRIFNAGIALIKRAHSQPGLTSLKRARLARNGLLIAFLALCPIRVKNLAALTLGESLIRQEGQWWLLLSEDDTKSKRRDHRIIPDILVPWIELYVTELKPAFPDSETAMWPSQYGGKMSTAGIQRLVNNTTRLTLGKALSPHIFRKCVPHTIAGIDGSRIGLASSLLQHSDPRTTEKHYNLASGVESSRIFSRLVDSMKVTGKGKHQWR